MPLHVDALAAAIVALASGAPAAAQEPGPASPEPQRRMMIARTLDEVPAWADRMFARLDANQDAAITADELTVLTRGPAGAMGGGRLRTMVAQSDASGDGRISREELGAGAARMFARMDANGDGRLSDEELPRPPAAPAPAAVPMPAPEPMPMPENPAGD